MSTTASRPFARHSPTRPGTFPLGRGTAALDVGICDGLIVAGWPTRIDQIEHRSTGVVLHTQRGTLRLQPTDTVVVVPAMLAGPR